MLVPDAPARRVTAGPQRAPGHDMLAAMRHAVMGFQLFDLGFQPPHFSMQGADFRHVIRTGTLGYDHATQHDHQPPSSRRGQRAPSG